MWYEQRTYRGCDRNCVRNIYQKDLIRRSLYLFELSTSQEYIEKNTLRSGCAAIQYRNIDKPPPPLLSCSDWAKNCLTTANLKVSFKLSTISICFNIWQNVGGFHKSYAIFLTVYSQIIYPPGNHHRCNLWLLISMNYKLLKFIDKKFIKDRLLSKDHTVDGTEQQCLLFVLYFPNN